jgi:protein TonB
MRWALALSAALHAGLGALALLRPVPRVPDAVPPIEVELVQQEAVQRGTAPTGQAPASTPPMPPQARQPQGELDPAPPPAPPAPKQEATPPEVNLGNGPQDLDPLTVTGDNIVPPAPDARYRNQPPGYPADAARAGAQGTVQLLVRVSASGVPSTVIVAISSGHPSLDAAARRAVLLWRFRPARSAGEPVPFDYVLNIRFTLGDR